MATPDRTAGRPLSHVLVLDLTQWIAGPYCTQILADLGARVIKVEPPSGDPTRGIAPHFVKGDSAYYHSLNRNKESIVVDLKQPKGMDLFLGLVGRADVVVENFRPGVMDRLGLGYARLSHVNPRIVMCSISGFGQDGPYRDRPAFDAIVQALSGGMSMTGETDGRSVLAGVRLADLGSGSFSAVGILAALAQREVTGRGQLVDVAMLDGQISMLSYQGVYCLVAGDVTGPQGRGHVSIPTYRAFTCADEVDILVCANSERMWRSLCGALGIPGLCSDPRFANNGERLKHKDELWPLLEAAFRERTASEWYERLLAADVPAAPVNTLDRALSDPQVLHRNMVVTVTHPEGDEMSLLGNPVKLSANEESFTWPPGLGEHTRAVLGELLGLSPEQVARLAEEGVVR